MKTKNTIRNIPSGGMERLQIFNGKVSKLRTHLGEFQIHDFRIFGKDNQSDFQDVHKDDVNPKHRMFWGLNRPISIY